jgi:hypothetical protein
VPDTAKREQLNLLEEHIASRKDFGRYLDLSTAMHRADVTRAAEFLA